MQERRNSIANAMELRLSCTKLSMYGVGIDQASVCRCPCGLQNPTELRSIYHSNTAVLFSYMGILKYCQPTL